MNQENFLQEWKDTIGLTVQSVDEYEYQCDDPITITVVTFTNGKFIIQQYQDSYTTTSGVCYEFEKTVQLINKSKKY